jgi:hypothetical protein
MPLWRIFPVPRDLESAQLGYGRWSEVIVRAETAAQARLLAAAELDDRSRVTGNESAAGYAGLEDEKLYHAARLGDDIEKAYASDRRREGVLRADWRTGAE